MKSKEKQLQFIDNVLLPAYGISSIIDYETKLNVNKINSAMINNINKTIIELKKVYPIKSFNLNKTNGKVNNTEQAIGLLKRCLSLSVVPFEIITEKKSSYLRLISRNNLLDKYINNKMSYIRDFKESKETVVENKDNKEAKIDAQENESIQIVSGGRALVQNMHSPDKVSNNILQTDGNGNLSLYRHDAVSNNILQTDGNGNISLGSNNETNLNATETTQVIEQKELLENMGTIKTEKYIINLSKFDSSWTDNKLIIQDINFNFNKKDIKSLKINFKPINDLVETKNKVKKLNKTYIDCSIEIGATEICASNVKSGENILPQNIILPISCAQYSTMQLIINLSKDVGTYANIEIEKDGFRFSTAFMNKMKKSIVKLPNAYIYKGVAEYESYVTMSEQSNKQFIEKYDVVPYRIGSIRGAYVNGYDKDAMSEPLRCFVIGKYGHAEFIGFDETIAITVYSYEYDEKKNEVIIRHRILRGVDMFNNVKVIFNSEISDVEISIDDKIMELEKNGNELTLINTKDNYVPLVAMQYKDCYISIKIKNIALSIINSLEIKTKISAYHLSCELRRNLSRLGNENGFEPTFVSIEELEKLV